MKPKRIWSWLWIIVGGLYFIIPLVATFLFSLQAKKSGPSLVAYQRVFSDPLFLQNLSFLAGDGDHHHPGEHAPGCASRILDPYQAPPAACHD